MTLSDKELEEIEKLTQVVFGQPFEDHRNLNGVDVFLRTIYDHEAQDALHRGMIPSNVAEQVFETERWRLAYSLISVNGVELKGDVEDKRKVIDSWLTLYVNMLINLYEEIVADELEKVDTLKKFSGTQEPQSI